MKTTVHNVSTFGPPLSACGQPLLLPRKAIGGTEAISQVRASNISWITMGKSTNSCLGTEIEDILYTNIYNFIHI